MVKVNVISGFLGAGKTTLIKKLLTGSLRNEKVVLLENEYGEIGIDGGFMKDAGITVTELNAGCICCTLAGDFQAAVDQLIDTYHPDRILVEPTGVGKLSEILAAVEKAKTRHPDIEVGGSATVVDAGKCRMYMKNFGEFFRLHGHLQPYPAAGRRPGGEKPPADRGSPSRRPDHHHALGRYGARFHARRHRKRQAPVFRPAGR